MGYIGANDTVKEKGITIKVLNNIREAIAKYNLINKGDHIVLGLSGGPDSVCLFFALYMLKDELGITLSAVHINHKFRPGAAEEDQEFVEQLCGRLGVRQTSVIRDCAAIAKEYGITSEEAGRRVRYEAFDNEAEYIESSLKKQKQQVKIAVAHNAEDQAETLLFRLIRGTGTDGLAGIERKRMSDKGYGIIRPILGIKRKDIEAFCEANALNPRIDHTNLEPIYARNKIRLGLIPYIEANLNENITETLNRLAAIAGEDKDYFRQTTEEAYASALMEKKCENETALSIEVLQNEHKAIRSRVILKAFSELGLDRDIGAQHIEAADNLIMRAATGKTAEFPYGYSMVTRYDAVVFKSPASSNTDDSCKSSEKCKEYSMGEKADVKNVQTLQARLMSLHEWNTYLISHRNMPKNFAAFDYEALCTAKGIKAEISNVLCGGIKLEYRARKPGDYIKLIAGTKKLQDLFVDNKIPRDLRDGVLTAALGSEILWIPGADSGIEMPQGNEMLKKGRYSSNYSVSDITKTVIILEITQKLC